MDLDQELVRIGLEPDDRNFLLLAPMAAVAWADGSADDKELMAIAERHASPHTRGEADAVFVSDEAHELFNRMLVFKKPDGETIDHLVEMLAAWFAELPKGKANTLRKAVADMCVDVAKASGGLLGLLNRIGRDERKMIERFVETLDLRASEDAAAVLDEVGL